MEIPHILTVSEAAHVLRVSTKTMYRLLREGDIEYVMVRGSYRITSLALEEYLKKGGSAGER